MKKKEVKSIFQIATILLALVIVLFEIALTHVLVQLNAIPAIAHEGGFIVFSAIMVIWAVVSYVVIRYGYKLLKLLWNAKFLPKEKRKKRR